MLTFAFIIFLTVNSVPKEYRFCTKKERCFGSAVENEIRRVGRADLLLLDNR